MAVVFSLVWGGGLSLNVSDDLLYLIDAPWQVLTPGVHSMASLVLTAFVVAEVLCFLQMTVSMFASAPVAYALSTVLVAVSAYGMKPVGFGAYAMAVRSGAFVEGGWSLGEALTLCTFIGIVSIVVGGRAFCRRSCSLKRGVLR